jgi:hypothetical protein
VRKFQRLLITEAVGFFSLLVTAILLAVCGGFWDAKPSGSSDLFGPMSFARAILAFTLILGALPVAFVGAPGYVFLHDRGLAKWRWVILLGLAPSIFFLPFSFEFALWAGSCGVAVASLTHLIGSRLRGKWSIAPTQHSKPDIGV